MSGWLRRYNIRPIRDQWGWAIVVLGHDGFFSAVSDYGNYAYIWGAHGCKDFREFVIGLAKDPHYALSKLDPRRHYDDALSERAVKTHILGQRRAQLISREDARREWELLAEHGHLSNEWDFYRWFEETGISDANEFFQESPSHQSLAFCELVLPCLAERLRAELADELIATGVA